MCQLSLHFAWKWSVLHGRAYKALSVFCRELMQLSGDLREQGPLLASTGLWEAIV